MNAKPCKHCGAAPVVRHRVIDWSRSCLVVWGARCPRCKHNRTRIHPSQCAAIEAWNKLQEDE